MFGAKTPFGGSVFGSSSSAFGSQAMTPFGQTSGLFGSSTPATGTFGTPSFGQAAPAFGNQPGTSAVPFGGNATAGTSLFGQPTTTSGFSFGTSSGGAGSFGGSSLFQSPQPTNAFGPKPAAFGGFGASSTGGSLFGTAPSAFGQTISSTGGLFGSTSSAFGQTVPSGTTVKFMPVASSDQAQKSGVTMTVKTQNMCITVMDQYSSKSIEELRLEDYAANRKSGSASGFAFGGTAAGGLFGAVTTTSTSSLFGSTTTAKPGFGGFGTSTGSSLFGQSSGGSLFGAKTTNSSLFGQPTATTTGGFGGFGTGTSGGLFGNSGATGTSLFGGTSSQPSSLFGTTSGFGSTNTTSASGLFGGTSTFGQSSMTSGLFGAKPAGFTFGPSSSASGFGSNTLSFGQTASSGGLFGSAAAKPAFGFGSGSAGFGNASSGFGGLGTNTLSTSSGLFGGSTSGGLFGGQKPGFSGFGQTGTTGALFGSAATSGTGLFSSLQPSASSVGGSSVGLLGGINQTNLLALQQQQLIQQQLKAIANSPFGDSPLFRNLSEAGKEKAAPSAQSRSKDLSMSSQYKIIARPAARVKPRPISSPSVGKSKLFEGFDEEGDFSPRPLPVRSSIKKLVIRKREAEDIDSSVPVTQITTHETADELIARSPEVLKLKTVELKSSQSDLTMVDNTFAEMEQHSTPKSVKPYVVSPERNVNVSTRSVGDSEELAKQDGEPTLCNVRLTRDDYYTEPTVEELNKLAKGGHCLVHNFIVGRQGYGFVKFLGLTDVYGLDLDEIVFFRRREVEVYPDSFKDKPAVGLKLNKPAEITLLKVWPNDKTTHTPVKTPERLKSSGFIERIEEKTCEMGATFIDYRPSEGAWQFRVEHFTRYGIQQQFIGDNADTPQEPPTLMQSLDKSVDFEVGLAVQPSLKSPLLHSFRIHGMDQDSTGEGYVDDEDTQMENQAQVNENIECEDSDHDVELEPIPFSHQLGKLTEIPPSKVQYLKSSVLDEDLLSSPATSRKQRQIFSDKSIFSESLAQFREKIPGKTMTSKIANATPAKLKSSQHLQEGLLEISLHSFSRAKQLFNVDGFDRNLDGDEERHPSKILASPSSTSFPARACWMDIPDLVLKCRVFDMLTYEDSVMYRKMWHIADAALTHGREFKISWGASFNLFHCGAPIDRVNSSLLEHNHGIFKKDNLSIASQFKVYQEQLDVAPGKNNHYVVELLEVALKFSDLQEKDGYQIRHARQVSHGLALHEFARIARNFKKTTVDSASIADIKIQSSVWDLVEALWGDHVKEDDSYPYKIQNARREALSQWLSAVVEDDIEREIEFQKVKDDGHLSVIFSLLSGRQIQRACLVAQQNKEMRLAFLISQACGDYHLRHHVRKQLAQWDDRNVDVHLDEQRLKIYVLLSGLMLWKSSNHIINICDSLDWRRACGLHLWYLCAPTTSITDGLSEYKNAYKGTDSYDPYAAFPHPTYVTQSGKQSRKSEDEDKSQPKDICYHLLALYCKRSHSLSKLLTPSSQVENIFDYQLSWHLHQVLEELGYDHLPDSKHDLLQITFAAQLENAGLWTWAVFVLMHLRDDGRRSRSVHDVIWKFCRFSESSSLSLTEEEFFVVNRLKVPSSWIFQAKALHAKYLGRHYEQAVYLIHAGVWDMAHGVIIKHLAPEAIIDGSYELLKRLLMDLCPPERCCTIKHWKVGGQVFLDYILMKERLDNFRKEQVQATNYHLEDMETEITALINRITLMQVITSKERLCQSDMARTCSNMLKVIHAFMNSCNRPMDDANRTWSALKVTPYVVDLPLPPDYYLQELRDLVANYVQEVAECPLN